MTAMGSAGKPSARACAVPSVRKAVEQIVTAALPRFAASMLSWILHDVHEPQSPEPVITTSHASVISRSTLSGAGTDADFFLRLMTRLTP